MDRTGAERSRGSEHGGSTLTDNNETLRESLISTGAVKFGDFTLASGRKSRYYVDIKKASTDPGVLALIAMGMADVYDDEDLVAGPELGAIPLAVALSLELKVPFVMIRREARSRGTGKRLEGPGVDGKRIVVVEDVITSGGSVVSAIEAVRAEGGIVERVLCVVDREEGGRERLADIGIELLPLVRASELLE